MQCEAVFSFVVGEEEGRGRGRYHLHPPPPLIRLDACLRTYMRVYSTYVQLVWKDQEGGERGRGALGSGPGASYSLSSSSVGKSRMCALTPTGEKVWRSGEATRWLLGRGGGEGGGEKKNEGRPEERQGGGRRGAHCTQYLLFGRLLLSSVG